MNYYNEFDPKAAAWLRELIKQGLIPDGIVDERSITDVRADDLMGFRQCHFFAGIGGWSEALRLAGIGADEGIWTGSCPCQAFSTAGKQKGFKDKRDLWPAFFNLIKICKPERVFGEQVGNAIRHGWLDRVHADLEGEDYTVGAVVLGAHSVGAPHQRQRLYWGAELVTLANLQSKRELRESRTVQQANAGQELEHVRKFKVTSDILCSPSISNSADNGHDERNQRAGGTVRSGEQGRMLEPEGSCPGNSISDTPSREPGGLRNSQRQKRTCVGNVLLGKLRGVCDNMADTVSDVTRSSQGQGNKKRTDGKHDNRNGIWNDDRNCGATSGNNLDEPESVGLQEPGSKPARSLEASSRDDCNTVGDYISEGLERHTGNGGDRDESGWDNKNEIRPASEASLSNNHWSDYQLIYCRDEKIRRIPSQSVLFGMVDGVSDGVDKSRDCSLSTVGGFPLCQKEDFGRGEISMLLKGIGNAIVPEVAAEFLKAWSNEINNNNKENE